MAKLKYANFYDINRITIFSITEIDKDKIKKKKDLKKSELI